MISNEVLETIVSVILVAALAGGGLWGAYTMHKQDKEWGKQA
jgi:hypothetical protein